MGLAFFQFYFGCVGEKILPSNFRKLRFSSESLSACFVRAFFRQITMRNTTGNGKNTS